MTPKPTPQGISRLLAGAGFTRAVSKLHGGVSGFSVSSYGGGEVEVRYSSMVSTSTEYRHAQLAKYVPVLTAAGYEVRTAQKSCSLIITTKAED